MSTRNLSRNFKKETDLTINEYLTKLRLEHSYDLLKNQSLSTYEVALTCGFKNVKQLERIWKKHHGLTPSSFKKEKLN